ncbi:hypothetical protein OG292_19400 [Streptomyces sp. NBC_01511]|uniref:hypothetical protein n=1 Tax=unclassified Streptomyces TaxID=2593676 RepID=UPI00386823A0
MHRITITETDEYNDKTRLGWFDLDATTLDIEEGTRWDGDNYRGVISGLQYGRSTLYRTKGGRWVENVDARRDFNGPNMWRFLTDDEAQKWLLRSEAEDAEELLEKHFPDTAEESGPGPQGGRPAVGPAISTAYPTALLAQIDQAAKVAGLSRAAWLRKVAAAAVAAAGV